MTKTIKILFLIFGICTFSYLAFYTYLGIFEDNAVVYARGNYLLEEKQVYIIELNHAEVDEKGNPILEANMFFTFRKLGEEKQYPYLSGRHIGSSKIDLNNYLGKRVYISGYFSMGLPIILKDKNIPEFLIRDEKVILNIDALRLVE